MLVPLKLQTPHSEVHSGRVTNITTAYLLTHPLFTVVSVTILFSSQCPNIHLPPTIPLDRCSALQQMPQNICCRRTFAPDITMLCSPDVSPAVYYLRQGGYVFVVVCLFVRNFAKKSFPTDLHEIFREGWQRANEQMTKFWWRSGSPSEYRNCFRIRHYWEIRKVVSTDCAGRRCRAGHAPAGITIATITSLRRRPTIDSHVSQWWWMISRHW